jgi:hypothetical protein
MSAANDFRLPMHKLSMRSDEGIGVRRKAKDHYILSNNYNCVCMSAENYYYYFRLLCTSSSICADEGIWCVDKSTRALRSEQQLCVWSPSSLKMHTQSVLALCV